MEQIPQEEIGNYMGVDVSRMGIVVRMAEDQDSDYTLGDYYADNPNDYYQDHMREELLKTYLFCKQTPIRPQRTNEIILTVNKGYPKYRRSLTLPNFENWVLRGALLQYCESHLEDIHSVEEAPKGVGCLP